MKNSIFFLLLLAGSLLVGQSFRMSGADPVAAADSQWKRIGSTKVNYALDRDEIVVRQKTKTFSALKLRIRRSALNLHKITVHYADGTIQPIDVRHNFTAGSESKVIDLPGAARSIQKVVFWYDTKNIAPRKAIMELWGHYDMPGKKPTGMQGKDQEAETKKKNKEKDAESGKKVKTKEQKD